ncbi:MAG TPA: DUF4436 family protein [Mycobacterium sp.]|nr:DUF4436 family protein [Mycobacterium sp.]
MKWTRRGFLAAGLMMLVFFGALFGYAQTGKTHIAERSSPVTDGVNIELDVLGIDPVSRQISVRAMLDPQGRYFDAEEAAFATSLRVTTRFALREAADFTVDAGQPIGGSFDFDVPVYGNVQNYPFDRYDFSNEDPQKVGKIIPAPLIKIDEVLDDGRTAPVPVGVSEVDPGAEPGWTEHWRMTAEGSTLNVELVMERSGAVLAAVAIIVFLVLCLAALSGLVAWAVATKRRPIEPTFASWFAAMLFALIPLQGFLPGAPPVGAWIDVTVFFWVEIILMGGLAVFIISWFKYREPPDHSHLERAKRDRSDSGSSGK